MWIWKIQKLLQHNPLFVSGLDSNLVYPRTADDRVTPMHEVIATVIVRIMPQHELSTRNIRPSGELLQPEDCRFKDNQVAKIISNLDN